MIETEQSVTIDAPIGDVWEHVRDIERWARLMPGMREFELIDANESRWTLKVGVGGLVRTVKVLVLVEEWAGPGRVTFRYSLEGDPVEGCGFYHAAALDAHSTEITLHVEVRGSGKLAPMWEAMGRPLLPRFARSFAGELKADIEAGRGAMAAAG